MELLLPDFDLKDVERCEEQVKLEIITPIIERAGWPKKQLRMGYVTKGQVMIDKHGCVRDKRVRKLDYLLISKGGNGLAVIEAKKDSYPDEHGIQHGVEFQCLEDELHKPQ